MYRFYNILLHNAREVLNKMIIFIGISTDYNTFLNKDRKINGLQILIFLHRYV